MLFTTIAIAAIALALFFDFVNGFHDTANAVATVIYTKALKPKTAIIMSGLLNFAGALLVGTAVAKVVTKIIPADHVSLLVVMSVLIAGLAWNLLTWYFALPVSSSHCLIGSLIGAGIAAGGWHGVSWGELNKVLLALIISPIAGFVIGGILTFIAIKVARAADISNQPSWMRRAQVLSSAFVSFSHGGNDGQKTMGIITLILAMSFPLAGYDLKHVPMWVMVAAATAMGLGTMIGGGRIIRTVGTKITRGDISYAHGFGAEFGTASIILVASWLGAPISTTHTLTSAVAGGSIPSNGLARLNGKMLSTILTAWGLTLPVASLMAAGIYMGLHNMLPETVAVASTPCAIGH